MTDTRNPEAATTTIDAETQSSLNLGRATMADMQNPLFIHPADQASQALVPFKLSGSENYRQWSRAILKAFSAKSKLGILKGTLQRTEENGDQWDRCNDLCCAWILGAVNPDIYDSIFELNTAVEMWTDLEDCYSRHTGPSKYQVIKEIHTIQQGNLSVSDYYTKLKGLWQKLASMRTSKKCECNGVSTCTCGLLQSLEREEEEEKLMVFLMGLNDTFTPIRGNLLLLSPLPSISKAYHLISQEEDQRKSGDLDGVLQINNRTAFVARRSETWKASSKKETSCDHCEGNHPTDKCWEVFGYPEWHSNSRDKPQKPGVRYEARKRGKKKPFKGTRVNAVVSQDCPQLTLSSLTSEQQTLVNTILGLLNKSSSPQHLTTLSGTIVGCSYSNPAHWVIDSGATDHMTYDAALLVNSTIPPTNTVIHLPNGDSAPILCIGDILLPTGLHLKNVLCIPTFKLNLISVLKLVQDMSCVVEFSANHCSIIQDQSRDSSEANW
ncbi:hypothetical protein Dimus_038351 [Dionaea muscipula]